MLSFSANRIHLSNCQVCQPKPKTTGLILDQVGRSGQELAPPTCFGLWVPVLALGVSIGTEKETNWIIINQMLDKMKTTKQCEIKCDQILVLSCLL